MPPPRREGDSKLLSNLGSNVQAERKRSRLTQERLAELIDVHPRIIQKIEAGDLNPKSTTLVRIQWALNVPWERLMAGVRYFASARS